MSRRDLPLELTVITSTLPERVGHLVACMNSVAVQERRARFHFVGVSSHDRTMMSSYNALAAAVATPWLFRLDDDDVLFPNHFAVLGEALDAGADIVYSWCRLETSRLPTTHLHRVHAADSTDVRFDAELRAGNFIPGSAAIRAELWRELGGYKDPNPGFAFEDWHFWLRALNAGARFRCVPVETWCYRPAWG